MWKTALAWAAVLGPALTLSLPTESVEAPQPVESLPCYLPCEVRRVIDGDTIVGDVVYPWGGVVLRERSIRCAGYDAPEVSRRRRTVTVTDAEIRRGRKVTRELELLLASGGVYVSPVERPTGPYGRVTARLTVLRNGQVVDVAEWARGHGYVRSKAE